MSNKKKKQTPVAPSLSDQSEVISLSGVGPARALALNRAGLVTISDLINYFPRAYLDRRWTTPIDQLSLGSLAVVQGKVCETSLGWGRGKKRPFRAVIEDATGAINCTWFNQGYLADQIRKGDELVLCGKISRHGGLTLVNPETDRQPDRAPEGLVPIYPVLSGISQKVLRKIIRVALEELGSLPDPIPPGLISRWGIPSRTRALVEIHFPPDYPALESARRRLILEEFFCMQIKFLSQKLTRRRDLTACVLQPARGGKYESFIKKLPFSLTTAQNKSLEQIKVDLAKPWPMRRLLLGDVGSGKTIVASGAALIALEAGSQVAVMAPTEVLARQLQETLGGVLKQNGARVEFLGGSKPPSHRKQVRTLFEKGQLDLVIGTQALITKNLDIPRLGLVIIDEQHRFGVLQKERLTQQGPEPHILVMTATPIPRTLAYTIYGDLDFSILDELPPGRLGIKTWWIGPQKLPGAYQFIREEVGRGRQAYLVYPLVQGRGKDASRSAVEMFKRLSRQDFKGLRLGLLHGGLDSSEKQRVMGEFSRGNLDILISTTVIELGIDVPNATVILIESAERFGLAQLHQLRGRVGRGSHQSYCILQGLPGNEKARRRLEAVRRIEDGFVLARRDMEIRGPGQFYGIRQHGLPELRLGDLIGDFDLIKLARKEAHRILRDDPELGHPVNQVLKEKMDISSQSFGAGGI